MVVAKKGQEAALRIQRVVYWGTRARHFFHAQKFAAVSLASSFRRRKVLRWVKAANSSALIFQNNWRTHKQLLKYKTALAAILLIQKRARMMVARVAVGYLIEKVVVLQAFVRSNCKRRKFETIRRRTAEIQAVWRPKINAWVSKREKDAGKKLAGIIKRKLYKMRESRYLKRSLLIQRVWRGCLVRKKYARYNRAAIVIQNMVRFDESKAEFAKRYKAARVVRRFMSRSFFELKDKRARDSATAIQRIVRGRLGKRGVWAMVWSALWIQKAWRGYFVRRNMRVYLGTLKLQSAFRGARDRQKVLELVVAAQRIINWYWKKRIEKKLREKGGVLKIQSWSRGIRTRRHYLATRRKVLTIQCLFRVVKARLEARERRSSQSAAVVLECWARCIAAKKMVGGLVEKRRGKSARR